MLKILFVCHGNICRSPMAEFLCRDRLEKMGRTDVEVASAATSYEEIGNPVHPGTRRVLAGENIDTRGKVARRMTSADYDVYDWIVAMDSENLRNIKRIAGGDPQHKVRLLLDFASRSGESIADPWYTGNFEETYDDICDGVEGMFEHLGIRPVKK